MGSRRSHGCPQCLRQLFCVIEDADEAKEPVGRVYARESIARSFSIVRRARKGSQPMKDEDSEEHEDVGCPFCDETGECDHRLLYFDVTFHEKQGGVVDPYEFETIIDEAFDAAAAAGKSRKWLAEWVTEFFDYFDHGAVEAFIADPKADRPGRLSVDFLFQLLTAAGGQELDGRLYDQSGPYCESSVRVAYADDPPKVFEAAKAMLTERLSKEIESRPEKGRRKRRRP
jgi:hypothetical protein